MVSNAPDVTGAKAEQKDRSHATILESAARLMRERGIAGASVADVMKGAGLTVGGFYAHFASKQALVESTLRRTAQVMRARLLARIDSKPALDRAEIIVKRYLSAAHRDDLSNGCALPAVVGEIAATATEHRDALNEQLQAFAGDLAPHLPPHVPTSPRQLALGLIALMYGGLTLARAVRGTELSDEILQACRALSRLALRSDQEPT